MVNKHPYTPKYKVRKPETAVQNNHPKKTEWKVIKSFAVPHNISKYNPNEEVAVSVKSAALNNESGIIGTNEPVLSAT
jgi:hypothetical protein